MRRQKAILTVSFVIILIMLYASQPGVRSGSELLRLGAFFTGYLVGYGIGTASVSRFWPKRLRHLSSSGPLVSMIIGTILFVIVSLVAMPFPTRSIILEAVWGVFVSGIMGLLIMKARSSRTRLEQLTREKESARQDLERMAGKPLSPSD